MSSCGPQRPCAGDRGYALRPVLRQHRAGAGLELPLMLGTEPPGHDAYPPAVGQFDSTNTSTSSAGTP